MLTVLRCLSLAWACLFVFVAPVRAAPEVERPPIILISIDTLRVDHLSVYGYERDTSPELERFAKDAIVFENAVGVGGGTLPVHMSMMTSLPPLVHGLWWNSHGPLSSDHPTLAQLLKKHGYATAGWHDDGYVAPRFGFNRGFSIYESKPRGLNAHISAASEWLRPRTEEPFFLFVHTYDVHSEGGRGLPYRSPEPFHSRYVEDYSGDFSGCVGDVCASAALDALSRRLSAGEDISADFDDEDLKYIRAHYDGGIRVADQQLGQFFDRLRQLGVYDKALILLTSDHGEEFMDHGRLLHGSNHEEIARVPLLLKLPGGHLRGRRVATLHSVLDYMPTLLAAAGATAPASMFGSDLVAAVEGGRSTAEFVHLRGGGTKLRVGEWSLFVDADSSSELGRPVELYNLSDDPTEHTNLVESDPERAANLLSLLKQARDKELGGPVSKAPEDEAEALSPELEERLRALGYLAE
jgi:arylsulfatase A-like enzyme